MTHSEYLKHIGMELRVARVRNGKTSTQISKITGLSAAAILTIERGESDAKILSLKRLADAYGISLNNIL